jgi:hypothetical protein
LLDGGLAHLWGPHILIQALRDWDEDVRWAAAWVLKEITGQDFGQDAAAWQQWWEEQQ